MANADIVSVTDATFATQVLNAPGPVLVKFEAQWCGPCKAMRPMIDEIAAEYGDQLTVVTLDIDENNQTPFHYGIRGVPTVLLFNQGEVVAQKVGLSRKGDLKNLIDSKLAETALSA